MSSHRSIKDLRGIIESTRKDESNPPPPPPQPSSSGTRDPRDSPTDMLKELGLDGTTTTTASSSSASSSLIVGGGSGGSSSSSSSSNNLKVQNLSFTYIFSPPYLSPTTRRLCLSFPLALVTLSLSSMATDHFILSWSFSFPYEYLNPVSSLFLSLSIYLSVCLSIYSSIYPNVYISFIHVSNRACVSLS